MSLQIESILLASKAGDVRRLDFKLGQVNVITGASNKGKSSLISIVEYCLGRSEFHVPEGVISDTVAWYAVIYRLAGNQVLVAKPPPKTGKTSQSEAYFEMGKRVSVPDFLTLTTNSNDEAITAHLTRALGVKVNVSSPSEGATRLPVEATLKHTRYYLFQDQGTVANDKVLFHRQAEPFMAQAIKDTLPYFLGVYDYDRIKAIEELRRARRELRAAEQRLSEAADLVTRDSSRAWDLYAEARQAGLVPEEGTPTTRDEVVASLRSIKGWTPTTPPVIASMDARPLVEEIRREQTALLQVDQQIHAAEEFSFEGSAFSREAESQADRLATIALFEDAADRAVCPVCHSHPRDETPTLVSIKEALSRVRRDVSSVARETPNVSRHLGALREKRDALREQVRRKEANLAALVRDDTQSRAIADRNTRAAIVVGRVSLFIDSMSAGTPDDLLQRDVELKRQRVAALQAALGERDEAELLESSLSWISSQMTKWAEDLKLEFRGQPYRFDLTNLTVVADRDGRPVPMGKRMGGGENWLGCHLIALLALHAFFIKNARPVPGFLILDQPTQVYFPPERYKAMEGDPDEMQDEDRVAVKRMYDFLFAVTKVLHPNLQIIVLDHAYLDSTKFERALVEKPWRKDAALIPKTWLRQSRA